MSFIGKGETNHWLAMDTTPDFGGGDAATKPLELVLIGLGGCSGMDVVSILRKKRAPLASLRVEVDADRAADHPKVFTAVRVVYVFAGEGLRPEDAREAVRLSMDKYCAISAILAKSCPVTYEIKFE
jgi:putative redox protein